MNNSSHAFTLLMEAGVNIEATLVKGFDVRATHLVAQFDYTKTLQELLENRAALDPKDVHGQTPLFYAVRHESLAAMRMLLQAGANVNMVDAYDYSILYYAVSTKNEESVGLLLRREYRVPGDGGEGKRRLRKVGIEGKKEEGRGEVEFITAIASIKHDVLQKNWLTYLYFLCFLPCRSCASRSSS